MWESEEQFDIFLAYHGDKITGSERQAENLFRILETFYVGKRKLNIFFYPLTNMGKPFGLTPNIVQKCKIFLLVANENIPIDNFGHLMEFDSNRTKKRLFEEVFAFSESPLYRTSQKSPARVVVCQNLSVQSAQLLHPIFNGTVHYKIDDIISIKTFIESILEEKIHIVQQSNYSTIGFSNIIKFGRYYQNNTFELEPIEWKCLTDTTDKSLLVSTKIIECNPYNKKFEETTWAQSDIRYWLNNTFYNIAFNDEEKNLILSNKTHTENNPKYKTNGGKDIEDRVFLLSIDEVMYYFPYDEDRIKQPTKYAKDRGAFVNKQNGNGYWWLRTPGYHNLGAAGVDDYGYVSRSGNGVMDTSNGCVPAIWIKTAN